MALEVEYEGIYASSVGEYKKTNSFKFKHEVVGNHTDCLESHLKKRYVPMMIAKTKGKEPFGNLVSFRLIDYKKNEKKCNLLGENILEMNEWQLQELARYYNLFDIPLPFTVSVVELREIAAIQYLKIVKKIPMENDKEKAVLPFFKKDLSNAWVVDFGEEQLIVDEDKDTRVVTESVEKVTLAELLNKKKTEEKEEEKSDIDFPAAADLSVDL